MDTPTENVKIEKNKHHINVICNATAIFNETFIFVFVFVFFSRSFQYYVYVDLFSMLFCCCCCVSVSFYRFILFFILHSFHVHLYIYDHFNLLDFFFQLYSLLFFGTTDFCKMLNRNTNNNNERQGEKKSE